MSIYLKVLDYINDNDLQLTAVAQKAGIPYATFKKMLSGKKVLYADELRDICRALNVSPETFITANTP